MDFACFAKLSIPRWFKRCWTSVVARFKTSRFLFVRDRAEVMFMQPEISSSRFPKLPQSGKMNVC